MSRNAGGGYFKDLGNLSQNFFNQIASDIRSNAEQIVSSAFQNESCERRGVPPDSDRTSQSGSRRGSSRRVGDNTATTNSSSASSPNGGSGGQSAGGGGATGRGPVPSSTSSSQATTPDEVVGDFLNQFVRGGGGSGSSTAGGTSSMGNTGFCGSKHTSTVKPSDNQDLAMLCDICQAKFTLFNRKKLCSECKAYFCGTCVSRAAPSGQQQQHVGQTSSFNSRTCKRCKILLSDPPIRADLMELRVKDLQRYLNSKNVNSRSCVEKKDLVELVIRQNGPDDGGGPGVGVGPSSSGSSGSGEQPPRPRRMPEERQKSFPKAYTESTHRHEWLEKMENAQDAPSDVNIRVEEDDQDDFIVVTTTVQPMEQDDPESEETGEEVRQPQNASDEATTPSNEELQTEETPVQPMDPVSDDGDDNGDNSEKSSNRNKENKSDTKDNHESKHEAEKDDTEASNDDDDEDHESSGEASDHDHDEETASVVDESLSPQGAGALPSRTGISEPDAEIAEEAKEDEKETLSDKKSEPTPIPNKLNLPEETTSPGTVSGSPRRFANQGLVYLSEIQTLQDVNELSVKQAKDILAMNRVNFKGVVEKDELLKHVARLWRQEKQAQDDKEAMNDSELCKICMDNPVDCVMLECGHMCTCTTCGKQMAECPICRQYVVRVVRTFKA